VVSCGGCQVHEARLLLRLLLRQEGIGRRATKHDVDKVYPPRLYRLPTVAAEHPPFRLHWLEQVGMSLLAVRLYEAGDGSRYRGGLQL